MLFCKSAVGKFIIAFLAGTGCVSCGSLIGAGSLSLGDFCDESVSFGSSDSFDRGNE